MSAFPCKTWPIAFETVKQERSAAMLGSLKGALLDGIGVEASWALGIGDKHNEALIKG